MLTIRQDSSLRAVSWLLLQSEDDLEAQEMAYRKAREILISDSIGPESHSLSGRIISASTTLTLSGRRPAKLPL